MLNLLSQNELMLLGFMHHVSETEVVETPPDDPNAKSVVFLHPTFISLAHHNKTFNSSRGLSRLVL